MMVLGVGVRVRKLENPESVLMIKLNRGHPPGPGKGALICLISRPSTLPISLSQAPVCTCPYASKCAGPILSAIGMKLINACRLDINLGDPESPQQEM